MLPGHCGSIAAIAADCLDCHCPLPQPGRKIPRFTIFTELGRTRRRTAMPVSRRGFFEDRRLATSARRWRRLLAARGHEAYRRRRRAQAQTGRHRAGRQGGAGRGGAGGRVAAAAARAAAAANGRRRLRASTKSSISSNENPLGPGQDGARRDRRQVPRSRPLSVQQHAERRPSWSRRSPRCTRPSPRTSCSAPARRRS